MNKKVIKMMLAGVVICAAVSSSYAHTVCAGGVISGYYIEPTVLKNMTVILPQIDKQEDTNKNVVLLIYPNPARNQLIIENYKLKETDNGLEIIDVLGHIQQSSIINQQYKIIIDISNLPKGMYFVKIGNLIRKFVKV